MKTLKKLFILGCLASAVTIGGPVRAQDDYTVRFVAGSPGFDQIQPFMAEYMGLWKKYGVNVEFIGGNYQRAGQLLSVGDFDVGYDQLASTLRYYAAGQDQILVGSSSANCAMIVAGPGIQKFEDLRGKRIGMPNKFDVQWETMINHVLPTHNMTASDVQLALVPIPEAASAIMSGDVGAVFAFEPYGTVALSRGAHVLVAPEDIIDKKVLDVDMLRQGMVMKKSFIEKHPELAKRLVWAHMDAIHLMRTDPSKSIEVLKHYVPNMDTKFLEQSYKSCGWQYDEPPKKWIETMIDWMSKDKLLKKPITYEETTNMTMIHSYPGYPGYEHLQK